MIIGCNYKDKNKGFSKHEMKLSNLIIELNNIQNKTSLLSQFEIFQIKCKLTDILQKFVDFCNNNVFWSFKLELKMVDDKEDVY
jgi:hypothetical protein